MKRRNFLKTLSFVTASLLFPLRVAATPIDFSKIEFDAARYTQNNAQTIMVFLYGGPSQLGANLSNIEAIKLASQSNYDDYFNGITPTPNGFWQEAGGDTMEEMLLSGDMNIFRTLYSQLREDEGNQSHGQCVSQNQRGVNTLDDTNGIFSIIANTLYQNKKIDENTKLPFISMEGESTFFTAYDFSIESFLKPTSLSDNLDNPYNRRNANNWTYYTNAERSIEHYEDNRSALDMAMDRVAQLTNSEGKIKENFNKRVELDAFVNDINKAVVPEGIEYPDDSFSQKLSNAIKILVNNKDTKIISLGSNGFGGWDDHSQSRDYRPRMASLFASLQAAMKHIKAEGRDGNINIMVWGDFGRNVNLNSTFGWDHGNLQNFYLFGGKNYFNHLGVVGETSLENTGELNRLYLKPAPKSYWFEPYSVAATLYSLYGIKNPEYLTGGFGPIKNGLLI
jgi:hypothetical protein